MTNDDEGRSGVAAPAGWQDWRRWVDGVDWSDWPAFRQWWRDGANSRPPAARARARLEEHMPELGARLAAPDCRDRRTRADTSGVVGASLRPPLYATRFHQGFGTLYTAEYRPAEGAVRYHWPGQTWAQSLDTFDPDSIQIRLGTP